MAATYSQAGGSVSIGRILSRTFGAITGNPAVMLGIAFLFGALPQTAISYLQETLSAPGRLGTADLGGAITIVIVAALASMMLALIVQGGLVRATMMEIEGDRATFGQCVASGFSRALPVLGVGLLAGLGIGFGFLLLILPGIILYLMWSVAIPVTVVERRGVIDSMSRSGDLTSGARGTIFGLVLIVWVVTIGAGMIAGAVGVAIYGMDNTARAMRDGLPIAALAVNAVVNTLVTVFAAAIPTALCRATRVERGADWRHARRHLRLSDTLARLGSWMPDKDSNLD